MIAASSNSIAVISPAETRAACPTASMSASWKACAESIDRSIFAPHRETGNPARDINLSRVLRDGPCVLHTDGYVLAYGQVRRGHRWRQGHRPRYRVGVRR